MKVQPMPMYPLVLQPAYQHYLWGGDRIPRVFQRALPPGVYAESWEVSDRPEGPSTVAEGALQGWTLDRVIRVHGPALLGAAGPSGRCPWLIKLIDARERLSVQVHPNARTAEGGEPKTEAWYVLADTPGAAVYAGFQPGVDEPALRRALADATLEDIMTKIPVARGDLIYVPGGLAHAIGAGCLLLEVQQNSNTTYRLYDWGRVGTDGRPRELHVEQAMRVMDWRARPQIVRATPPPAPGRRQDLMQTPFFSIARLALAAGAPSVELADTGGCQALFTASGAAVLAASGGLTRTLAAGSSVLIPAAVRGCRLASAGSPAEVILVGSVRARPAGAGVRQ